MKSKTIIKITNQFQIIILVFIYHFKILFHFLNYRILSDFSFTFTVSFSFSFPSIVSFSLSFYYLQSNINFILFNQLIIFLTLSSSNTNNFTNIIVSSASIYSSTHICLLTFILVYALYELATHIIKLSLLCYGLIPMAFIHAAYTLIRSCNHSSVSNVRVLIYRDGLLVLHDILPHL